MLNISPGLLMALGTSKAKAEEVAPLLEKDRLIPGDAFNSITSLNGIAAFVATLAEESGRFTVTTEGLNYSVAALGMGNRPKYFTAEQAAAYGRLEDERGKVIRPANQRMIANLYYGGRMGNRGVNTDDGWDFRGAAYIQNTGRRMFTLFGESLGITPEEAAVYMRTTKGACEASWWYWRLSPSIIKYAARGDFTAVSQLVNAGQLGATVINMNARLDMWNKARAFLNR